MDKSPTELMTEEIVNEIEIEKIQQFYEDVIMREAVKKVLLLGIYGNGTLKAGVPADPKRNFLLAMANNPNMKNEELGQELRAAYWGVTVIEQAFAKLAEVRVSEQIKTPVSNLGE